MFEVMLEVASNHRPIPILSALFKVLKILMLDLWRSANRMKTNIRNRQAIKFHRSFSPITFNYIVVCEAKL